MSKESKETKERQFFTDKIIMRCLVPLMITIAINTYVSIKTIERNKKDYDLQREVTLHILDRIEKLESARKAQ